jgi:ABC-2 type transport system ATP-binding protein
MDLSIGGCAYQGLRKAYAGGVEALKGVDLDIQREESSLCWGRWRGRTTLISIVCGSSRHHQRIHVGGHDNQSEFRAARSLIGLVPQELTTDAFETVWATVSFSRGLFGKPKDDKKIEEILRRLTLWDKRNAKMMELSGGMKRRVMIAKALSHEPSILFLDEPTAGVDVELRRDMWELVRKLRADGTTIILTTHYIEEAEEMADRVGVIRKGELVALGDKKALMAQMGQRTLKLPSTSDCKYPQGSPVGLAVEDEGHTLCYPARQPGAYRHSRASAAAGQTPHRLQGPRHPSVEPPGHLRQPRP